MLQAMEGILEAPTWQAVGSLTDQSIRDLLAGHRSLSENVAAWFKAVDLFRETQDERMVLREPTADDLRQHRTWVASLIGEGERLLTEAVDRGEPLGNAADPTPADVEATLEMLYLSQREWHGPRMPTARRREILKTVFNVQEPSA